MTRKNYLSIALVVLSIILPANYSEAANQEPQSSKILYFEIEPVWDFSKTKIEINIPSIPESVRTVPSHPSDPYTPIAPIQDGSYSHDSLKMHISSLRAKCLLWNLIGVGVRITGGIDNDENKGWVRLFDKDFAGNYYDYSDHYSPYWGDAYVIYQTRVKTEVPNFGFFLEAKSPTVTINKGIFEQYPMSINIIGGWEPDVAKVSVYAMNGYDRWDSMEVRQEFDLGEVSFDRIYGGIEFGFTSDEIIIGGKLLYFFNQYKDNLTDLGDEAGITKSGEKGTFAGSLFIRF